MMHFLTFAGKSSHDFGLRISGEGTFNRPKRRFDEYEVPGRNGTLLIDDNSFENIPVTYPAFVIQDMPLRVQEFANYMSKFAGYQRLEDTYTPDMFRLAQYRGGLEVTSKGYMNRMGEFKIEFNCKPQRFLKSGENAVVFDSNGQLMNKTEYDARPLIRINGSGSGTVGIGSNLITLSAIDGFVDIDCELMDAYKGTLNCNSNVSFNRDIIALEPGTNGVTFTGDVTSVIVTPRFYIL